MSGGLLAGHLAFPFYRLVALSPIHLCGQIPFRIALNSAKGGMPGGIAGSILERMAIRAGSELSMGIGKAMRSGESGD